MTHEQINDQKTAAWMILMDNGFEPTDSNMDTWNKGAKQVNILGKWIVFNGKDISLETLKAII